MKKVILIIAGLLAGLFDGAANAVPTFQAAGTAVGAAAAVSPVWPAHAVNTDPIPANTDMFIGDLGGAGSTSAMRSLAVPAPEQKRNNGGLVR